jgi:DNA/RNA-binding domain of Phe-tRNA-synthetase-like protein
MDLAIEDAPQLDLQTLAVRLPAPLGEVSSPAGLTALLRADGDAPITPPEQLCSAVRDLLRGHGYRPTGRGKPSSEYLAGAASDGRLGSINAVVDAGNAASLHSGLPISVVDLARAEPPFVVRRPPAGTTFVFNRGGQEIDVGGLLCLCDAHGPCANAVKDAQRSKTDAATRDVLALVWAPLIGDGGHARRTAQWLAELFGRIGAVVDR